MRKYSGFTLVELLVVIAIIAILATIAGVVFRGVTISARDAQRKADLNSISKAYEIKYSSSSSYSTLATTDFAAGKIPKTPEGNSYPCLVGPETSCITQATDRVAYCVSLGDNQSSPCYSNSSTCFCTASTQGSSLSGGGGGGGGGSNPSCDPYGILTSGLVGYWKMDDNVSGNSKIIVDSSGVGNNGTTYWGANVSGMNCTIPGKNGGACSFDGNDYVSVGLPSDYEITDEMTIGFWVKPQAQVGNWTRPIAKGGYLDNGWTIYTGAVGDNYFYPRFGYNGTGGWSGAFAPAIPFQLGQWQHITVTVKLGSVGKSYLNGILVGSQVPGVYYSGTIKKLTIGGEGYGSFLGDIDDVRIYNRVLSPSEIYTLFNNNNGCVP